jgi:hypothetical protein
VQDILILNGKPVAPIVRAEKARNRNFFEGNDELGPFVAYKLDNRWNAQLYGWYIFVSPEDLDLMKRFNWCGNICGGKNGQHVEVRRREYIGDQQRDFLLHHEIWERMNGAVPHFVHRIGHQLDFRRQNLSSSAVKNGHKGVTSRKYGFQVQIAVDGKSRYIGRTATADEGYRKYNRFLRHLKNERPADPNIQQMPYNQIEPMF